MIFLLGKKSIYFQNVDLFKTNLSEKINNLDVDVVQLNWINNLISIKDISRISKPIVWRFSDMWPFLGTEHYTDESNDNWQNKNISNKFNFLNLDSYVYNKKIKYLKKIDFEIVAPSNWMKNMVSKSYIMSNKKNTPN